MGLQLVVVSDAASKIEDSLNSLNCQYELFEIEPQMYGVSVPTDVVKKVGQEKIFMALAKLRYNYLWSGEWNDPVP